MADYKEQGVYQEGNSLFDDIFAFGDLEVQNINVVGIITAKTFSGVDATSLKDDTGTVQIQATTTGATHSGRAVFNEVELQGKVYDSDGDFGSSGQVLSSDGTDIEWVNAGSLSAGSAAQVSVANEASDATCFPLFSTAATGNLQTKSNSNLTFNSSNGTLSATSFSGNLSGNVTGTIQTAAQTNITSVGTLTGLTVNGTVNVNSGNQIQLYTSANNLRGQIEATETNDAHLIIATSGGEDIAFKDGSPASGTTNMIIRGDGNILIPNGGLTASGNINANGNIVGDNSTDITGIDAITASSLTGSLQTASQTNITSVGTLTGLTVDGNVILDSTSNYLHIKGAIYDKDGQSGSADQVLVSTGTQVDWKDATSLTASNSQKITIAESDTNSDFPITFSAAPGQSGGNTLLSDNQFTYNASTNLVTAGTFSGSGASLTSLNASNLQSGTVADARLTNTSLFATGMIMLWYGSVASIPSGWVLCDGNNSTPDLRNRFVIGAGTGGNYSPDDTGGSADAVLVSHTHNLQNHVHGVNLSTNTDTHSHSYTLINFDQGSAGGSSSYGQNTSTVSTGGDSHSHTVSGNTGTPSTNTTDTLGESATNKNLPPYYALCYIMKT